MMQACTVVRSQTLLMASGSPLRPSQTAMHTSASDAAVLQLGQHLQPNFAPSPPSPSHRPKMSRSPFTVTPITT